MSRNDAVSEPRAQGGSEIEAEAETDGSVETVDLGIGISIDIDVGGVDGDAGHAELAFDEDELLESTTDEPARDGADDGSRVGRNEIGPDERETLADADVDPDAVREKGYSYRMLLDAGVDESTAAALRRRFSLAWSFESDGDLERRSAEVRGLGDAEREWIAVSGDEGWQAFEYEQSPVAAVGRQKPSERPWPKPTSVTAVTGVGPDDADKLAEAGIHSAERLATISAFEVASVLDIDVLHVRTWRHNARELLD